MNRHLHNSDDIVSSAQYGWEQMKLLLDENLPVINNKSKWQLYKPFIIAASLITVFLFSSIVLQNIGRSNFFSNSPSPSVSNKFEGNKNQQEVHNNIPDANTVKHLPDSHIAANKNAQTGNTFLPDLREGQSGVENELHSNTEFSTLRKVVVYPTTDALRKQHSDNFDIETGPYNLPVEIVVKDSARPFSTVLKSAANKGNSKSNWNVFAGVGINAMIGERQHLQPFPMAELRYNVTPGFYVSLGLSPGAPVSTDSRGIGKTVYLNDTINNIRLYNKVIKYSRLYYTDIPLMAGVKINKNISLRGGLQASVLLGTKNTSAIERYDFQMRLANGAQNTLVTTAAPVDENNYEMSTGKIDYRFVTGINYAKNKTSINLLYQHSLQPVFKGNFISNSKHQIITVSVLYKLK